MNRNLIGSVDKIRVLKQEPKMLVRFTLAVGEQRISCLCANKQLIDTILCLVDGSEVVLFGEFNKRNQLVVKRLIVRRQAFYNHHYARSHA